MRIELNQESANALRDLASAMPYAIMNITESTTRLIRTYQSVADEVGPHEKEFHEMLLHIKKMQIEAAEAIQQLPPKMIATAEKLNSTLHASHRWENEIPRSRASWFWGTVFSWRDPFDR